MAEERRQHQRISALFEVVWEGAAGRYEARTADLSLGGCFIDTIGQATVGEIVTFRLRLPAGDWLELRGEVTYQSPHAGFGVKFTGASEIDRKHLAWLIRAEELKARHGR